MVASGAGAAVFSRGEMYPRMGCGQPYMQPIFGFPGVRT